LNLQLLHHHVAVSFDGAFRRTQQMGDLLVQLAADDQ
jgi:hypothetical protein